MTVIKRVTKDFGEHGKRKYAEWLNWRIAGMVMNQRLNRRKHNGELSRGLLVSEIDAVVFRSLVDKLQV